MELWLISIISQAWAYIKDPNHLYANTNKEGSLIASPAILRVKPVTVSPLNDTIETGFLTAWIMTLGENLLLIVMILS